MLLPLIREHQRMLKLPLPTTRADYQRMKLKDLLKMPKNTKTLMKRLERELNPRMLLRVIVFLLSTPLMMTKLRTNSALLIKAYWKKKLEKLKPGFQAIMRLTLPSMKENLRLLRIFSTQSCKISMLKVECLLEAQVSLEVQDSLEEHLDTLEQPLKEQDHQAQVSIRSIDVDAFILK